MSNVDAQMISYYATEISNLALTVRDVLSEAIQGDENGSLTGAAFQLVSQIGYLGDRLNATIGEGPATLGGADKWLLPPCMHEKTARPHEEMVA